jgi:hypothetical protein
VIVAAAQPAVPLRGRKTVSTRDGRTVMTGDDFRGHAEVADQLIDKASEDHKDRVC